MAAVNLPAPAQDWEPGGIPARMRLAWDWGPGILLSPCAGPMAMGCGRWPPAHRHWGLELALGYGLVWSWELGFGLVWSLALGFECRGAELAIVPRLTAAACSWWRVKSLLGWEMPPPD